MDLREFAYERTLGLLGRVRKELDRVTEMEADADAIHDLRVSIRRLTQALRALRGVIPKKDVKQIRRKLRSLMDLAAEIRNRDIAMELLEKSGVDAANSPVGQRLAREREEAREDLVKLAKKWRKKGTTDGWLAGAGVAS